VELKNSRAIFELMAILVLLTGCGKAPQPVASQASATPSPEAAVSPALTQEFAGADNPAVAVPEVSVTVTPSFKSQEANEAFGAYYDSYRQLTGLPAPQVDPINNPQSVISSINQVGNLLEQMNASERTLKQNASPAELQRFRAWRKELTHPEPEE
jgi:hypothetical protein